MNSHAPARSRIDQPLIGTWLSIGSPVIAEIASECGFDWLLFDHEHGCSSEDSLFSNLQAIRGSAAMSIVRVGLPHSDVVQRALDWGANGIMVPHVRSAADAEACVMAAHYPPRGRRGMSRSVRAYRYGMSTAANGTAVIQPLLMVQIESLEAVENVEAIAAVDGADVLFVGPGDLSYDLSVRNGESARRTYDECLDRILNAASTHGKKCGILVRDIADVPALLQRGFTHIAIDSDVAILRRGYQSARAVCASMSAPPSQAGKTS
jgi:2-keto-3-deoxy-L-rhamnonate aldolase RhmA